MSQTICTSCTFRNGGRFTNCPLCKVDVFLHPALSHKQAAQVAREIGGSVEQTDANNFRVGLEVA